MKWENERQIKPFSLSKVLVMLMSMKKLDLYNVSLPESPKIDSGFKVPEGYFESFGERLQLRMETEKGITRSKGIIFYLKPLQFVTVSLPSINNLFLRTLQ